MADKQDKFRPMEVFWSKVADENDSDVGLFSAGNQRQARKPQVYRTKPCEVKSSAGSNKQQSSQKSSPRKPMKEERQDSEKKGNSGVQKAALKDLCVEDKRRVANLIRELARAGEEKENVVQQLEDERQQFNVQLQELCLQQDTIMKEREDVQMQLIECQKLLAKYQACLATQEAQHTEQTHPQENEERRAELYSVQMSDTSQSELATPIPRPDPTILAQAMTPTPHPSVRVVLPSSEPRPMTQMIDKLIADERDNQWHTPKDKQQKGYGTGPLDVPVLSSTQKSEVNGHTTTPHHHGDTEPRLQQDMAHKKTTGSRTEHNFQGEMGTNTQMGNGPSHYGDTQVPIPQMNLNSNHQKYTGAEFEKQPETNHYGDKLPRYEGSHELNHPKTKAPSMLGDTPADQVPTPQNFYPLSPHTSMLSSMKTLPLARPRDNPKEPPVNLPVDQIVPVYSLDDSQFLEYYQGLGPEDRRRQLSLQRAALLAEQRRLRSVLMEQEVLLRTKQEALHQQQQLHMHRLKHFEETGKFPMHGTAKRYLPHPPQQSRQALPIAPPTHHIATNQEGCTISSDEDDIFKVQQPQEPDHREMKSVSTSPTRPRPAETVSVSTSPTRPVQNRLHHTDNTRSERNKSKPASGVQNNRDFDTAQLLDLVAEIDSPIPWNKKPTKTPKHSRSSERHPTSRRRSCEMENVSWSEEEDELEESQVLEDVFFIK